MLLHASLQQGIIVYKDQFYDNCSKGKIRSITP